MGMSEVRINLNDNVRFRLTETGKEIYRRQRDEVLRLCPGIDESKLRPIVDSDGCTQMQLHEFMNLFGPHLINGAPVPVERVEIICDAAETAHVLTLNEVQSLSTNDVVWLEDKGKLNVIPGIVRNRHLWPHSVAMITNFMRSDGYTITAGDDDYGIRWRCWTSRPTEKQMREAKWNE